MVRPEALGHTLMTNDPFWVRLVADDALLDIAEQFVGPDIALFASAYICKPPRDGQPVLWHQDGSYWPLDPMNVVTLWLAIDDSTQENACMRVIPGSHKSKLAPILPRTDIVNALSSSMDARSGECHPRGSRERRRHRSRGAHRAARSRGSRRCDVQGRAAAILTKLHGERRIDGVHLARRRRRHGHLHTAGMRALPLGFPKLMVSRSRAATPRNTSA